jgi:hypothetical protein
MSTAKSKNLSDKKKQNISPPVKPKMNLLERKKAAVKEEKMETEEDKVEREAKDKEEKLKLHIKNNCTILEFFYLEKEKNKSYSKFKSYFHSRCKYIVMFSSLLFFLFF